GLPLRGCEALNLEQESVPVLDLACEFVERGGGLREQIGFAGLELNSHSFLNCVFVEACAEIRNRLLDTGDAGVGLLGGRGSAIGLLLGAISFLADIVDVAAQLAKVLSVTSRRFFQFAGAAFERC